MHLYLKNLELRMETKSWDRQKQASDHTEA